MELLPPSSLEATLYRKTLTEAIDAMKGGKVYENNAYYPPDQERECFAMVVFKGQSRPVLASCTDLTNKQSWVNVNMEDSIDRLTKCRWREVEVSGVISSANGSFRWPAKP